MHVAFNGLHWAECPVILRSGSMQLEFCARKDNEIAVTWDEVNVEEQLEWYGSQELNLEWRKNAMEPMHDIIGQTIMEIEVMEAVFDAKDNRFSYVLHGLGFTMQKGYVSIVNAFDETGFSFVREESYRYTKL